MYYTNNETKMYIYYLYIFENENESNFKFKLFAVYELDIVLVLVLRWVECGVMRWGGSVMRNELCDRETIKMLLSRGK